MQHGPRNSTIRLQYAYNTPTIRLQYAYNTALAASGARNMRHKNKEKKQCAEYEAQNKISKSLYSDNVQ